MGIGDSTIKKYETGYRNPKYEQLMKIADALGISINYFYENSIKTTGELISTLALLEEETDVVITGDKDSDGNYIEDTISISFKNPEINKILSRYMTYKSYTSLEDKEKLLSELFAESTPIF